MNIKRKLSEGVSSWLMFEFHSNRGRLFGEKYLTTPIGHILSGIYENQVAAELIHPILNSNKTWAGRPPQIDFGISENNQIKIAVESKWIGKTSPGIGDIIWDLIRLELLNNSYQTTCFFVLGGQKKRLQLLFDNERFQEQNSDGRKRPILRLKKERKQSIRLDSPPPKRALLIKDKMKQYKNVSMPSGIVSGYPVFHPKVCRNSDYQVYVWEISSYKSKPRFFPKDNEHYK
jgi:hypothetical protein